MFRAELNHIVWRAQSAFAAILNVVELDSVGRAADSSILAGPLAFTLVTLLDDSFDRLGYRSVGRDPVRAGFVDDPLSFFHRLAGDAHALNEDLEVRRTR